MGGRLAVLALVGGVLAALPAAAQDRVLQSTKYPLQVHHTLAQKTYAQQVLKAAEEAWHFHVEVLGMPAPPNDLGERGSDDFDVVLGDHPAGAACRQGLKSPDRNLGYATHLIIDPPEIPTEVLPLTLSHEFHHATQAGICPFGNGLMESSALYTSGTHRAGEGWMLGYFLGINDFQAHPERSLDWEAGTGDFYPYGSALFLHYLDQHYGAGKPLGFVGALWKKLEELSRTGATCPDHLAAIGRLTDLDQAFKRFTLWRYFTGPNDDGQHFVNLANWEGARSAWKLKGPRLDAEHSLAQLPVKGGPFSPMSYGASLVRVDLSGAPADKALLVELWGDPAVRWSVGLAGTTPACPTCQTEEWYVDADSQGYARKKVKPGAHRYLVLAVANQGPGAYSTGGAGWVRKPYRYELSLGPITPEVDALVPESLVAGESATLEAQGHDFPTTEVPLVSTDSADVVVGTARVTSESRISFEATVAAEAQAQRVHVTFAWAGGNVSGASLRVTARTVADAGLPGPDAGGGPDAQVEFDAEVRLDAEARLDAQVPLDAGLEPDAQEVAAPDAQVVEDGGGTVVAQAPTGCGCSSTAAGWPVGALLVLAAAALRRRAR